MDRRTFLTIALAAPAFRQKAKPAAKAAAPNVQVSPQWTQWGGPHRNFQTEASGLKDTWPATGPRVIWKRPLGEGYSSPAVENGVLYTLIDKTLKLSQTIYGDKTEVVVEIFDNIEGPDRVEISFTRLQRTNADDCSASPWKLRRS